MSPTCRANSMIAAASASVGGISTSPFNSAQRRRASAALHSKRIIRIWHIHIIKRQIKPMHALRLHIKFAPAVYRNDSRQIIQPIAQEHRCFRIAQDDQPRMTHLFHGEV